MDGKTEALSKSQLREIGVISAAGGGAKVGTVAEQIQWKSKGTEKVSEQGISKQDPPTNGVTEKKPTTSETTREAKTNRTGKKPKKEVKARQTAPTFPKRSGAVPVALATMGTGLAAFLSTIAANAAISAAGSTGSGLMWALGSAAVLGTALKFADKILPDRMRGGEEGDSGKNGAGALAKVEAHLASIYAEYPRYPLKTVLDGTDWTLEEKRNLLVFINEKAGDDKVDSMFCHLSGAIEAIETTAWTKELTFDQKLQLLGLLAEKGDDGVFCYLPEPIEALENFGKDLKPEQKFQLLTILIEKAGENVDKMLHYLPNALERLEKTAWSKELAFDQKLQLLGVLAEAMTVTNDTDVAFTHLADALEGLEKFGKEWKPEQKLQLLILLGEKARPCRKYAFMRLTEALEGLEKFGNGWTSAQKLQLLTFLAEKVGKLTGAAFQELPAGLELLEKFGKEGTSAQKLQFLTLLAEKTGEGFPSVLQRLSAAFEGVEKTQWNFDQTCRFLGSLAETGEVESAFESLSTALTDLSKPPSSPEEKSQHLVLIIKKWLGDNSLPEQQAILAALKKTLPHNIEKKDLPLLLLQMEQSLEDEEGKIQQGLVNLIKELIPHVHAKDKPQLLDKLTERFIEDAYAVGDLTPFLRPDPKKEKLKNEVLAQDSKRKVYDTRNIQMDGVQLRIDTTQDLILHLFSTIPPEETYLYLEFTKQLVEKLRNVDDITEFRSIYELLLQLPMHLRNFKHVQTYQEAEQRLGKLLKKIEAKGDEEALKSIKSKRDSKGSWPPDSE